MSDRLWCVTCTWRLVNRDGARTGERREAIVVRAPNSDAAQDAAHRLHPHPWTMPRTGKGVHERPGAIIVMPVVATDVHEPIRALCRASADPDGGGHTAAYDLARDILDLTGGEAGDE